MRVSPATALLFVACGFLHAETEPTVHEHVSVSAFGEETAFAPESMSATTVDPLEATASPSSLGELLNEAPSVAENGQGGLFQAYSVRGVSRRRVQTLVAGMRIVGERRAGVSTSFLDPTLMGSVDVLRGPASTFHGSGALGGVIAIAPRRLDGWEVEGGYETQGDESFQRAGWGDEKTSFAIARRAANGAEAPDGDALFSGFEQTSLAFSRQGRHRGLDLRLDALASVGHDIEKANTDHPVRSTIYPSEHHVLVRLAADTDSGWHAAVWAHPNRLETRVTDTDDATDSRLDNRAVDLGLRGERAFTLGRDVEGRAGLEWIGRRGVDAVERTADLAGGGVTRSETLFDGEEDEVGVFGALEWKGARARGTTGARVSWQQQQNDGGTHRTSRALTGFVGTVVPLPRGFEAVANVGTGIRFPSLSERFFSGTTGAGSVVSTLGLDPERSWSYDAGLHWFGDRIHLAGFVFRNDVDDYIERIEVAPDTLTFRNFVSGTIEGIELEGYAKATERLRLSFGAHSIRGRANDDTALADVPADRVFVSAHWDRGRWTARGRVELRGRKDDPGSGEVEIASASLLSGGVDYAFADGLTGSLTATNLLDEEYRSSADRRVPLAPGRSVAISLRKVF